MWKRWSYFLYHMSSSFHLIGLRGDQLWTCYKPTNFRVIALFFMSFSSKPQKPCPPSANWKSPVSTGFFQGTQDTKNIPQLISLILDESYGIPITDLISWKSRNTCFDITPISGPQKDTTRTKKIQSPWTNSVPLWYLSILISSILVWW